MTHDLREIVLALRHIARFTLSFPSSDISSCLPDLFIRLPGSTPHVRSVFGRVGKSPLIRGSPTSGTRGRSEGQRRPSPSFHSIFISVMNSHCDLPAFLQFPPLFCPPSDFLDPSGERVVSQGRQKYISHRSDRQTGYIIASLITIKRGIGSDD